MTDRALLPIYRTSRPESAANLLLKHYRTVLVRANYRNYTPGKDMRVRFRADDVRTGKVFFGKVKSQVRAWQAQGGALVMWSQPPVREPHDACLFAECPYSFEELYRQTESTKYIIVVYVPPTWTAFEEIYRRRYAERPSRHRVMTQRLACMKWLMEMSPELSLGSIRRLRARESSRPSAAPALPESAAHSAGIAG